MSIVFTELMSSDFEDDLSFLNDLDAGISNAVMALIKSDLSDQEKLQALAPFLDQQQLENYRKFCQKQELSPREKFLGLLNPAMRTTCLKLLETGNFKAVRTLIATSEPYVHTALDDLERIYHQEMSPIETFLSLLKPTVRTTCRKLLETGNFRAVETLIPTSEPYIHSALDDLERTYMKDTDTDNTVSQDTEIRRNISDKSTFQGTLKGKLAETIVLDPISHRHVSGFESKLRNIENIFKVFIDIDNYGQDFKVEISGNDKDLLRQSVGCFMEICESQDFKYESEMLKSAYMTIEYEGIKEIFQRYSCICFDQEYSVLLKGNEKKKIEQAKNFISEGFLNGNPSNAEGCLIQKSDALTAEEGELNSIKIFTTGKLPDYPNCALQETLGYGSQDLSDRSPDEPLNILLLGESGCGKSTFVNAIANYLEYENFEDALRQGVKAVIPTRCSFMENKHKSTTKEYIANFIDDSNENEELRTGMSSTQECCSYCLNFGDKSNIRSIRIIDTPGMGDCRGAVEDDQNLEEIVSYLSQYEKLHAICIILTPDISNLSPMVRKCLEALLLFQKSMATNIMFCFTHAAQIDFEVGEVFPLLEKYLRELSSKETGVILSESTCFCFDNEFLLSAGLDRDLNSLTMRSSWIWSRSELKRLLEAVENLESHTIPAPTPLYSLKKVVCAVLETALDAITYAMDKSVKMERKISTIKKMRNENYSLKNLLRMRESLITIQKLDCPMTVCTSTRCTLLAEYKTCHNLCTLKGIVLGKTKNPLIRECRVMNANGYCKMCDCSWEFHSHQNFRLLYTNKLIVDEEIVKRLGAFHSDEEKYQAIVAALDRDLQALKTDYNFILNCCAALSAFLSKHSIAEGIDYVHHNLNGMLTKVKAGEVVVVSGDQLQLILNDYEMCRLSVQCNDITEIQANDVIKTLHSSPIIGRQVKAIVKMHLRKCSKPKSTDCMILVKPDLLLDG